MINMGKTLPKNNKKEKSIDNKENLPINKLKDKKLSIEQFRYISLLIFILIILGIQGFIIFEINNMKNITVTNSVLNQLKKINQNISSIKSDVSSIESDVSSIESDVKDIENNIGTSEFDFGSVLYKLRKIESDVKDIENNIGTSEFDFGSVLYKLRKIESDVSSIESDVSHIKIFMKY